MDLVTNVLDTRVLTNNQSLAEIGLFSFPVINFSVL